MNISSLKDTEILSQDKISPSKVLTTSKLTDCLKPTILYDKHKLLPSISSDSIEKMYQELGSKEGTTHILVSAHFF